MIHASLPAICTTSVLPVTSDLLLHLDMADATKMYTDTGKTTNVQNDGDIVALIADKSGNATDFEYTSPAGRRPTYKTAIQNGLSVLRFDGTDDRLSHLSSGWDGADDYTFFWVSQGADNEFATVLATDDRFAPHTYVRLINDTRASPKRLAHIPDGNYVDMGSDIGNEFHYFTLLSPANQDANTQIGRMDGSQVNTGTRDAAFEPGNLTIGCDDSLSTTFPLNGDIAEIIVYSVALTAEQINAVEAYLATKWGL